MTPSALHVLNYRSFPGPQALELRPLTLLYGHNSAGKSALVRLLPLLADSVGSEQSGPLNLAGAAARGSSFQDLRWKGLGEDDSPALTLGLEWRGDPKLSRAEFELEWERSWERLLVQRFRLFQGEGTRPLEGRCLLRSQERQSTALTYRVESPEGGEPVELPIRFRGLVPEVPSGSATEVWTEVRERLLWLKQAVLWLGARQKPARILQRPVAPRWGMLPDGSDVGEVLASQPTLRERVSAWCQGHLQRSVETRDVLPAHFRVTLQHLKKAALDVDLVDAGEGLMDVLPVLVALELGRVQLPEAPRLLAIEEPESHLHPKLQRALAEHLASTLATGEVPCIILKTHSQHILLQIQVQLARGILRPEQVQVYWVHQDEVGRSRAYPVPLDEEGRLSAPWPADVYSEAQDMAADLVLARRELR